MTLESIFVTIDRLGSAISEIEKELSKVESMDIENAAVYYEDFRNKYDSLEAVVKKWTTAKDRLSSYIIPTILEDSQLGQSVKLKSGKTVVVQYKVNVSMPDKDAGMQWLRDNELGELIQETVNSGTLTAVAKGRLEENNALPEELFKMSTKASTAIRKAPTAKRK